MAYLLDANIFIQAKNLHYGFDFCPAFWTWLDEKLQSGVVASVSQVGDELIDGTDDLAVWAKERKHSLFPAPEPSVLGALTKVSAWATGGGFDQAAVNTFLQIADSFLVAAALAHGHTLVTHELPSNSLKKIKIPTACLSLGVPFCSPYQMLRKEKARFILGRAAQ
jgi:hypothetical protein